MSPFLLLPFLVHLVLPLALAAEVTVDPSGGGDFLTIQDAIEAAAAGDTVWVTEGVYNENVGLRGRDIALRSVGGAKVTSLVTSSGTATLQVNMGEGSETLIEGFTITNSAGMGLALSGTSPVIRDCVFSDNVGPSAGGAVSIQGGSPTLEGLTFEGNQAEQGGDLYIAESATVSVTGSNFYGSRAQSGGSVTVDSATVSFIGCAFSSSSAAVAGGALVGREATVNMDDVLLEDCSIEGPFGGALYLDGSSTLGLHEVEIRGARATNGAALFLTASSAEIDASLFEGNSSEQGGAIYASDSTIGTHDSSFSDNSAELSGGAMALFSTLWTDSGSSFTGNTSSDDGGAVYSRTLLGLSLDGSTFSDNVAVDRGGALYLYLAEAEIEIAGSSFLANSGTAGGALALVGATDLSLEECFLQDNLATSSHGGGLYLLPMSFDKLSGSLSIQSSLLEGNGAALDGGALYVQEYGSLTIERSVLSRNQADQAGEGFEGGALRSLSVNVLTVSNNRFSGNGALAGGALRTTDADVESYRNNIFMENTATLEGGGLFTSYGAAYLVENNTFVGNGAIERGGQIYLQEGAGLVRNNIVEAATSGGGIWAYNAGTVETAVATWNDVHANEGGDWAGSFSDLTGIDGNQSVDPSFVEYSADGEPANDDLMLAEGSACIDAGDPELLDIDGSISDQGAYGGLGAIYPDRDEDGWDLTVDCEDSDPTIHPDAKEIPYDGVDQDCDGTDLVDADGDGFTAEEAGGDDCDDQDPDVHPDALEVDDGVDNDCDGLTDPDTDSGSEETGGEDSEEDTATSGEKDTGCGCTSSGGGFSAFGVSLLALLLGPRRRPQGPTAR